MKRSDIDDNFDKRKDRQLEHENKAGGFRCAHCGHWVTIGAFIGTANRNHCNYCLWSKHVDTKKGDRLAVCRGSMRPIGLTFKHEGYGRIGEIMLIHLCETCGKISINRIAGDDSESEILNVFDYSTTLSQEIKERLASQHIILLAATDRQAIMSQLFGNDS
jgi:RNHCP domain